MSTVTKCYTGDSANIISGQRKYHRSRQRVNRHRSASGTKISPAYRVANAAASITNDYGFTPSTREYGQTGERHELQSRFRIDTNVCISITPAVAGYDIWQRQYLIITKDNTVQQLTIVAVITICSRRSTVMIGLTP